MTQRFHSRYMPKGTESKYPQKTWSRMFLAAIITIARNGEKKSINWLMDKQVWYNHKMEYYLSTKENEVSIQLVNRKGIIFHQNNARPHVSVMTRQKLLLHLSWEVLMHLPYSSDIAPLDFYLFRVFTKFS